MRIAILSDVHFCAPFTLAQIAEGFSGPVHVVFGNNDGDQFLLSQVAAKFPHVTMHGDFAELVLDGRRVAVTHYPEIGRALAEGGIYDLVCHGHSHERLVEPAGKTVRVNPGEVMGRFGVSTYALYDTVHGRAEILPVVSD
jgi:putative phosphoesterase